MEALVVHTSNPRQEDLCEFKAVRSTKWDPASKIKPRIQSKMKQQTHRKKKKNMQWTFKIRVLWCLQPSNRITEIAHYHGAPEASGKVGKRVRCCLCNRGISLTPSYSLPLTTVCHPGTNMKGLWNTQSFLSILCFQAEVCIFNLRT